MGMLAYVFYKHHGKIHHPTHVLRDAEGEDLHGEKQAATFQCCNNPVRDVRQINLYGDGGKGLAFLELCLQHHDYSEWVYGRYFEGTK
jgi:hypothetical protein